MGRMKENPRYNVISLRVSDEELAELNIVIGDGTRQEYLLAALTEKFINDRQARIDALVGAKR